MKRILLAIILSFLLATPALGYATRNIQDNHQIIYHIVDSSGNHVGSQTVALKIKRISDGYWFDFSDSTFKNTGWTSKSTNLSEDTTEGYYYYTWDPPASESSTEQYMFLIDNSDAAYGDHQSELICYQDIGKSDFDYSSNQVTVATNNDKTGYSLTQSFPTNFEDLAITPTTGKVTVGTNDDKTGYSISGTKTTLDALNDIADSDVWGYGTKALTDKSGFNLAADQSGVTVGTANALGTQAKADVNNEVDSALADVNLDHLIPVASTVSDTTPAAGNFDTALTEITNDHYNDVLVAFTSGVLVGQARRISDYDGTSKNIIISPAFTEAPANGDSFVIIALNTRTAGTKDSEIDAIKAKTDNLPVDPADDSDIDSQLATIQTDLDTPAQYKADVSNLDVAVSSRAPEAGGNIAAIKAQTDKFLFDVSSYVKSIAQNSELSNLDALISSRLASADYTAPDNTSITAIKNKTDNLNFNADVTKLLQVDIRDVNDTAVTGVGDFKADVSNLDVAISSRLASSGYTAPDNTNIGNIIGLLRNGTGYATCPTNKSIWDALGDGTLRASSSEVAKAADYTSARAGYLDKLNVSGVLAHSGSAATYKADVSNLDVAVSSRSSHTPAETWAYATRGLTDKSGFSLSSAGIDAFWDELQVGHDTVGSFGYYLDAQVSSGSGDWTSAEKTNIKSALSIDDGSVGTSEHLAGIKGYVDTLETSISAVGDATDGDKEAGVYTGIEKMIRIHR